MQGANSSLGGVFHPFSNWRLYLLVVSYVVMLVGVLSSMRAPMHVTVSLVLGGACLMMAAEFRTPSLGHPAMRARDWMTVLAGMAVIIVVLNWIGEETVRHWTPHPAGYFGAWLFGYHVFRHFRQIVRRCNLPITPAMAG
jgi:hypothetical protein